MGDLPFDKPGRFYRGNLHTHSVRSDGTLTPEELVTVYRERGYDFLAVTDHFLERYGFPVTDTRALRSDSFITLLGAELHGPQTELGNQWHIVAVGLPSDFSPSGELETGPELAERAAQTGAFVGMAHPAWYGLTIADAEALGAADAVEVYNETCVQLNDRGDSWYLCDALLARGRRVMAFASDDAHFDDRPDAFSAWVQVRANSLDPDSLLAALKAGHYYSSTGPEIHDVRVDGDAISIECSTARSVLVTGRGATYHYAHSDGILTAAEFPLSSFAGSYCRVTIVDVDGKRAWSNPIWLPSAEQT